MPLDTYSNTNADAGAGCCSVEPTTQEGAPSGLASTYSTRIEHAAEPAVIMLGLVQVNWLVLLRLGFLEVGWVSIRTPDTLSPSSWGPLAPRSRPVNASFGKVLDYRESPVA